MNAPNELLRNLGQLLLQARLHAGLTQEETADRAGISRPRYRDVETGVSAARATTLFNIVRALGLEIMFVPQAMVPGVQAMLRPADDDDRPAFTSDPEDVRDAYARAR